MQAASECDIIFFGLFCLLITQTGINSREVQTKEQGPRTMQQHCSKYQSDKALNIGLCWDFQRSCFHFEFTETLTCAFTKYRLVSLIRTLSSSVIAVSLSLKCMSPWLFETSPLSKDDRTSTVSRTTTSCRKWSVQPLFVFLTCPAFSVTPWLHKKNH